MPAKEAWRVTSQAHDQVIVTQAGQSITGTYVYFLTGEGNEGSVFVPDPIYNEETVKAMVHDRAAKVDRVGRLHSGMS